MEREVWLDYSRAVACFLVAMGHLFMSFIDSGIIKDNIYMHFFIQTIYYFHVYIFFFCSGYLYQKTFIKCVDIRTFITKKWRRILDIFVPYLFFTAVTYYIKILLSESVNTEVTSSFFEVMFKTPINQMWFLYALVIISIVTPVIKSNNGLFILFIIALGVKVLNMLIPITLATPLSYLFANEIWFVLGMVWKYKDINLKTCYIVIVNCAFVLLAMIEFRWNSDSKWLGCVLTILGVVGVIEGTKWLAKTYARRFKILEYLAKYMFPIYLLHTICAAGIRIVLLKLGITHFIVHFFLGVIFSFIIPIICAIVMEKSIYMNIVMYPVNTVKMIRERK